MENLPDLKNIEIPTDLDKTEFDTDQRRADMYRDVVEAGGVEAVDTTYEEYAATFDMSVSQIGRDMNVVRQYIIEKELDTEQVKESVASNLRWALKEAKSEGDYNAVPRIVKQYKKYAQDVGKLEKSAEKHEIEHKGEGIAERLRDAFEDDSD